MADQKKLQALCGALDAELEAEVGRILSGDDPDTSIYGFDPCHIVVARPSSTFVFRSKLLKAKLASRLSARSRRSLAPLLQELKLPWPQHLEEEKRAEVGYTPLHMACMFGCKEAIEVLLEAGSKASHKTPSGWDSVELSSYRSGELDLQFAVCIEFLREVHTSLVRKFTTTSTTTEGAQKSTLDVAAMLQFLVDLDCEEWSALVRGQYGEEAKTRGTKGAQDEVKGLFAELEKEYAKLETDAHKVDALPDLDEIYSVLEELNGDQPENNASPGKEENPASAGGSPGEAAETGGTAAGTGEAKPDGKTAKPATSAKPRRRSSLSAARLSIVQQIQKRMTITASSSGLPASVPEQQGSSQAAPEKKTKERPPAASAATGTKTQPPEGKTKPTATTPLLHEGKEKDRKCCPWWKLLVLIAATLVIYRLARYWGGRDGGGRPDDAPPTLFVSPDTTQQAPPRGLNVPKSMGKLLAGAHVDDGSPPARDLWPFGIFATLAAVGFFLRRFARR